ncbi:MAG: glycosyltransferase family 4 protein [Xenophilus sp.]
MLMFSTLRRRSRKILKIIWAPLSPRGMLERRALRQEASLQAAREGGRVSPAPGLDLFSDADVSEAAGLPRAQILWAPVRADEVTNGQTAARFMIDLLRGQEALRARFPMALSQPADSGWLDWVRSEAGRQALRLGSAQVEHLVSALSADPGARARQAFLADAQVGPVLAHGLTPAGRRALFRWFMRHGCRKAGLELEEVWWLFMQAAEAPRLELVRAYLFAPAWQRRFPDALTVFGWKRFAEWFSRRHGAEGDWAGPVPAPDGYAPGVQLRMAYWARPEWQARHPRALSGAEAARAFLAWIAGGGHADASDEVRQWCRALDVEALVPAFLPSGMNILGHFCYPSGLKVSAESLAQSLGRLGLPASLRNVRTDVFDEPHDLRFCGQECSDITLIHVQPTPHFDDAYPRAHLAEREPRTYRIAYWYWEFDSVPASWAEQAGRADEVWTATEFIARGLRERLSVPVRTLFPGVSLAPFEVRDKASFGLRGDRFTFLFVFHMMSVMERKNPLGLIRAFAQAFRPDERVSLVLKTSFGERYPEALRALQKAAAASHPGIVVINEVYSADKTLSLIDACDAYVSLHRSEGLGLTMAEAMLLGKPVIATNFSGNVDFMDRGNSLLVDCERVRLGRRIAPYSADDEWAEPSTAHAAQLMRRVYDDPPWARELGEAARRSAQERLSLEAAGRRIAARLDEIRALRGN